MPKLLASHILKNKLLIVACALEYALLNKIVEMALFLRKFLQGVKK